MTSLLAACFVCVCVRARMQAYQCTQNRTGRATRRDWQPQHIDAAATAERTVTLSCGHAFHDFCIRGWTIVGKKDTCPYCGEKVSLKNMFSNPWETQSLMWANLLDAVRYLIVWNPVIVGVTQLFLYEMGMTEPKHH